MSEQIFNLFCLTITSINIKLMKKANVIGGIHSVCALWMLTQSLLNKYCLSEVHDDLLKKIKQKYFVDGKTKKVFLAEQRIYKEIFCNDLKPRGDWYISEEALQYPYGRWVLLAPFGDFIQSDEYIKNYKKAPAPLINVEDQTLFMLTMLSICDDFNEYNNALKQLLNGVLFDNRLRGNPFEYQSKLPYDTASLHVGKYNADLEPFSEKGVSSQNKPNVTAKKSQKSTINRKEKTINNSNGSIENEKEGIMSKDSPIYGIGAILLYIIRFFVSILPFVMISGNLFINIILISISTFFPLTSIVFWIWGLVCAIKGTQDVIAIIYYISFVVIWIPFFISTVISFFRKNK